MNTAKGTVKKENISKEKLWKVDMIIGKLC